jgi:hypothetical protein
MWRTIAHPRLAAQAGIVPHVQGSKLQAQGRFQATRSRLVICFKSHLQAIPKFSG